jgi:hypothetical protein
MGESRSSRSNMLMFITRGNTFIIIRGHFRSLSIYYFILTTPSDR